MELYAQLNIRLIVITKLMLFNGWTFFFRRMTILSNFYVLPLTLLSLTLESTRRFDSIQPKQIYRSRRTNRNETCMVFTCFRWGGTLQACTTTETGAEQSKESEWAGEQQSADGSGAIVAADFRYRKERHVGRQPGSKFRAESCTRIQDATALRGGTELESDSTGS